MEDFVVEEVVHEGLEAVGLVTDFLEVVESRQYNFMSAFDQADGGKQFKHKRLRPEALVDQAEGDAVDGLAMLYHHVEAILEKTAHVTYIHVRQPQQYLSIPTVPQIPPCCS